MHETYRWTETQTVVICRKLHAWHVYAAWHAWTSTSIDQSGQVKPGGQVLWHLLSRRTRSTGTLRLMTPRTLALMAVQRHTAASRSARPASSGQHRSLGGTPSPSFTRFSTVAHTPSFSVSIGHVPPLVDGGGGGVGVGQWGPQPPCTAVTIKFRPRSRRKSLVNGAIAKALVDRKQGLQ